MTLTEALQAAARRVEQHKAALAWDWPEDDRARAVAEVPALGHELDALAAASETAPVYRREVEAITRELQRWGFTLAPEIARAVDDAFLVEAVARAPAPRFRIASRA